MIFEHPLPFREALDARASKAVIPNTLSSQELKSLGGEVGERALVIANLTNAQFGEKLLEELEPLLNVREAGQQPSRAAIRAELKDWLRRNGYQPELGTRGTIQDFSTDARLNLIINTQVQMMYGYGQWESGQQRAILYMWPAYEFVRKEDRREPRDWPTRWADQGGEFYPGIGPYPQGRMIALKNSSIWTAISAFGLPYPPFDFNSGMGLRDVGRDECERLRIIRRDQTVAPQSRNLNADMRIPAKMTAELEGAVLANLGPGYSFKQGVLGHV